MTDAQYTWAKAMERQLEAQRDALRLRDPAQVAHDSGAIWDAAAGALSLRLLDKPLQVRLPDYVVFDAEGKEAPTMTQGLLAMYLMMAKGIPRMGDWIVFRELPDGLFYHQAFDGYTGGPLVRAVGDNLDGFRQGARAATGFGLTGFGDAAFEFRVLPQVWLAVAYWLGDDEDGFPPQAKVLFDRAANSYLTADGLAILGSQLAQRIIRGMG